MFINHLEKAQQEALFCFAKKIISADDRVDESESLMLETIRSQCDSDIDFDSVVDLGALFSLFDKKNQKVAFMMELIALAHADDIYQESEKEIIINLANELGVSDTLLQNLESWVKNQMILVKEAHSLMEE